MLRVLLTNDDGIEAEGLQALRRALVTVEDVELAVIAPDSNRSATARSITTRRPIWVEEIDFGDGTVGYATDGTPVDCVRLAALGLIDGFTADLIVVRHQPRLQPRRRHHLLRHGRRGARGRRPRASRASRSPSSRPRARWTSASATASTSTPRPRFVARLVEEIDDVPLPEGHAAQRQRAGGRARRRRGARASASGSTATSSRSSRTPARTQYRIYGDEPDYHDEEGTDLAAVAAGRIAVTPLHFDLTDRPGIETLQAYDLARLLAPAAGSENEWFRRRTGR